MIRKRFALSIIVAGFVFLTSNLFSQSLQQITELQKSKAASSEAVMPVNVGISSADKARLAMTSEDYMVTAGDVYNLSFLAGNSPVSFSISVDSSYKIRVANLAVLNVANISFINLKRQVEELVTKNYPMSGVQFNLISPGSFKVVVKGEVPKTIEEEAWALTRLSEVVNKNKNSYGSIRNIKIESKNGKSKIYDLFQAQRYGDFSQDPYLRPGDIITIQRIDRVVEIKGAVERPGIYELMPGENLKDLIEEYGHGLTPMADVSRIQVTKKLNTSKTGGKVYLEGVDESYVMDCYDSVSIATFNDLKPIVFIEGAIGQSSGNTSLDGTQKVSIRYDEGLNYANLIRDNEKLFHAKSDLKNAYIIRDKQKIPFNIEEVLYDNSYYSELYVEPYDTLIVPFMQLYVSVAGAVAMPGRYPYIPDRTYDYYIGLAGGFIGEKNTGDKVDIINSKGEKLSKSDIITPETTITAKANSFTYYFNQYAPIITTILGLVTTSVSLGFMFTK